MASRLIKPVLLLLPFLLNACTSDGKSVSQAQEHSVTRLAEQEQNQDYAAQIHQAVIEQFSDRSSYKGKKCTVRISIAPDGLLLSAEIEKGDPEFCQDVLSAITRAKIPPAPDKETWLKFKNAPLLDFAS